MANYLTLVEQLSVAVDQLNQILQGDEKTTVIIDGTEQPSVQKKTLDQVTEQIQLVLSAAADIDAVKYPTIESGMAATSLGNHFSVVSEDSDEFLNLYKNADGIAEKVKTYPTTGYIEKEIQPLNNSLIKLKGDLDQRISPISSDDDILFSLQDEEQREVFFISKDGTFTPYKIALPEDAYIGNPSNKIKDLILNNMPEDSGDLFVIEDSEGRILARFSKDGTFYPSKLDPALLSDKDVYVIEPSDGAIYVNSNTTGQRILVYNEENPANPIITSDNYVVFDTDSGSKSLKLPNGVVSQTFPDNKVAAFGDSLTAAGWIDTVVEPALGVTCTNLGRAGYGSTDIAVRQGGITLKLSLKNNQIPASGDTEATVIYPTDGFSPYVDTEFGGTINGIDCVLRHDVNTNAWTLTRTSTGSVINIPNSVEFIHAAPKLFENQVQILWMGRNNVGPSNFHDVVTRNMQGCVERLRPYNKRYVVVSVTNASYEPIGTQNYDAIINLNAAFAEKYGERYFDLRKYLIEKGLSDAGITPTEADLVAISEDRIPPSIMNDAVHPNEIGYEVVGNAILNFIKNKGWF